MEGLPKRKRKAQEPFTQKGFNPTKLLFLRRFPKIIRSTKGTRKENERLRKKNLNLGPKLNHKRKEGP